MPALYSDTLLDHFRHPRNYGDLFAADISYESFNPVCGDRIRIALKLNDGIVESVRFKGDASLLTELIVGRDIADVSSIPNDRLIAALESDIKPARLQCALLPLEALRAGLHQLDSKTAI